MDRCNFSSQDVSTIWKTEKKWWIIILTTLSFLVGNKAVWTIKYEEGKGMPRANIRLSPPCYSSSYVLCNGRYAGEIAGQVRHNHVHFEQLMSV
ncbi:hypothetical protein AVEN_58312-1 [Araneus ventricosus]|uniref:Uncharacterized protein n=1 Tax=Araneus ventricosus TaxID=182803 RepID=A0A4Y2CS29_ARAVE|nr:hypothetical protein AVEN_58312-1 [Araneus ventricosus]